MSENVNPGMSKEFYEKIYWDSMAKAKNLAPVNAICCWNDIYGFGKALSEVDWCLDSAQAKGLIEILSHAYKIIGNPALIGVGNLDSERILILNDGIARTIDLPSDIAGQEL